MQITILNANIIPILLVAKPNLVTSNHHMLLPSHVAGPTASPANCDSWKLPATSAAATDPALPDSPGKAERFSRFTGGFYCPRLENLRFFTTRT